MLIIRKIIKYKNKIMKIYYLIKINLYKYIYNYKI